MAEPKPENFELSRERVEILRSRGTLYRHAFCLVIFALSIASFVTWAIVEESDDFHVLFAIWYGLLCGGLISGVMIQIARRIPIGPFRRLRAYDSALKAFQENELRMRKEFWIGLSGLQFEVELARLYRAANYVVQDTPASGDGGIDLIISRNGEPKKIVQCKRHKSPVGVGASRDLYGALMASQYGSAVLASVSGFTSGTRDFCYDKPIQLLDLDMILEMQEIVEFKPGNLRGGND